MRIVIVDDDRLAALSLSTIVGAGEDMEVIGRGYSGEEAVKLYDALNPDILLMDIRMEGITGLEAARRILARHPAARILFLTTFSDDDYILQALRMGAKGYILKQHYDSIIPALRAVKGGQRVFGDAVMAKLPELMRRQEAPDWTRQGLTEKEGEVTALVAQGLNNREIAAALYLSEGTVRNTVSAILEKLNLRDRTQLAIHYYKTRGQ